jgi:two-component system chemotaxis response regulator CheY
MATRQKRSSPGVGKRVMKSCLVVDDSSIVRKVARRILEDLDYIVDEAEDGQEAFDKCRQEMPDAILLDWQMPVMGGLEFLKLLRAYVGGAAPRVVYMVTEYDVGQIALGLKAGASDYMMKPFDRDILEKMFLGEQLRATA